MQFYSLQKADESASSPPGLPLTDWTGELTDLADTAALIQNLDLVITADSRRLPISPGLSASRSGCCSRTLRTGAGSSAGATRRGIRPRGLFRQPRVRRLGRGGAGRGGGIAGGGKGLRGKGAGREASRNDQVIGRHGIGQPDVVGGFVEDDSVAVHLAGRTSRRTSLPCRVPTAAAVSRVSDRWTWWCLPLRRPVFADRLDEAVGRSVVQDFGRLGGGIAELHFHRVPLIGADAAAVVAEGEAFFVAGGDHRFQVLGA